MNHSNPILKETKKTIKSGIHRKLITSCYQMGETFMVTDGNSFYDMSKIETTKKEPQYC